MASLDATAVGDPLLGARLGDYQVVGTLGEGGMGVVYEGLHTVIHKRVAIKVIKPEYSGDQILVRRVLAEAQAVNAVRHRGIVDIHAHGLTPDGRPYLVMELLHGETLHDLLTRKGPLSQHEAIALLLEATGPLLAAHKAGIVHRDLKPSNLFLCQDDDGERFLKLLDFGLAKRSVPGGSSSTMTSASLIVGTPDYMAPEQARAQPTDARTDIYALGVLAFELLAGRLPYTAGSSVDLVMQHLAAPVPRLIDLDPSIPLELSQLVEQMMAKEPSQRPQTLEPVRALLKGLSARSPTGTTPEVKPGQVRAAPVTPAAFEPTFVRPSPESLKTSTQPQLEPVPVERTVVAPVPETDLGTADTAASLKPVSPRPSGRHREGAPSIAVLKREPVPEPLVTVVPAEDSSPPAPKARSKALLLVGAGSLVAIGAGLVVLLSQSRTIEPVEPVVVTDVKPEPPVLPPEPGPVGPAPRAPETRPPETRPPETRPPAPRAPETRPPETRPVAVEPSPHPPEPKSTSAESPRPTAARKVVPSQEELRKRVERRLASLTDASPDVTKRMLLKRRLDVLTSKELTEKERAEMAKALDEMERK